MKQAVDRVSWFEQPTSALDAAEPPFFKWFTDGKLNLSYNCLDRHLDDLGRQGGVPLDRRARRYKNHHVLPISIVRSASSPTRSNPSA